MNAGLLRDLLAGLSDLLEQANLSIQMLIEDENGGDIAAAIAVVGRRPDGDQRLLGEHVLVALLHQLMRQISSSPFA